MATITKEKNKKPVRNQKISKKKEDFVQMLKKAQDIASRLYKEGKIDVYNPAR